MSLLRSLLACLLLVPMAARAGEVAVAVAANFTAPMKRIAEGFAQATGHRAVLSFGSTGKLYAQIHNGAPFEVLLAADSATPEKLEAEGLAVEGTRFTYAVGQLALWSADAGLVDADGEVLQSGGFERLAVADAKLAPYGRAARQTLEHLGLAEALKPRLVTAESIGQSYQFVASGNASLGFVALSQIWRDGQLTAGSAWRVPNGMHDPLRQDLVVLAPGEHSHAARALAAYLRSDEARDVIRSFGYEVAN
ncbi:MAG: molybdate ABC transporter substrate-binding protein [Rhodocyclaceae bacterium]|nr:molybdate ABC transporter substrate-binding protein [Rhodocyclaceae bacterium]